MSLRVAPTLARALAVGVVSVVAVSCRGPGAGALSVFGRLEGANEIFFAQEMQPECSLEASLGDKEPTDPSKWVKVPSNALTNRQFTVFQRDATTEPSGDSRRLLALRDAGGTAMWVRNAQPGSPQQIEDRWSCAVAGREVQALSFDLHATAVQLLPYAPHCRGIAPITGSGEDVRFAPYTLVARRLYVGVDKKPVLGVTLAAPGGDRLITVAASELQACFGAVTPKTPSAEETTSFLSWVTLPSPDAKPAPPVSFFVVLAATGLDANACLRDGATGNMECRQPLFGVAPSTEPGPFGAPALVLSAQRVVGALHGVGDKLVSGGELPSDNVVVRAPKVKNAGGAFARYFNAALSEATLSAEKQLSRGARGARMLRPQDVSSAAPASFFLDVDVTYAMTFAPVAIEKRTVKTIPGAKPIPNPELVRARANAARATEYAALASKEAPALRQLGAVDAPACSGAAPVCNFVATTLADFAEARGRAAATRAQLAEDATKALPETVPGDDVIEAQVKVIHGHGEAKVDVKLTGADPKAAGAPASFTLRVPFAADNAEVPNDPAHKLTARAARTPSQDEVDKALAEALITRLDVAIGDFAERRSTRAEAESLQAGTRAWVAGAARYAAGDRPVKLFGDVVESRPEILQTGSMMYPVNVPSDGEQRCFTFVAAPTEGFGDVNLSLGYTNAAAKFVTVATDARRAPVASFELCHMRPGSYALAISWPPDAGLTGISASMFDSTPGLVPPTDASPVPDTKPAPDTKPTPTP